MKSLLVDLWIRIQASYWFIPSIMAAAAIVAAVGLVHLDSRFGSAWLLNYEWIYENRPAGARALLSTVAGSMITVAGVTFSMTLLAVSHASAQIGPRLLGSFMRDRGNQFTLGTFIATFLYCLMVLRTVRSSVGAGQDGAVSAFVPHLAIIVAVAMAILSVLVLIYYIHHVPQSISVSNVVARVGDELMKGIHRMYPQRVGKAAPDDSKATDLPVDFLDNSQILPVFGGGGYLRVLDGESLLESASDNGVVLEMLKRPGDFAIDGQPLARVWPRKKMDDDLAGRIYGACSWGMERTQVQDIMFPTEQLIEILGKAMSPGVNGQYTALLCIDQLERSLAELLHRDPPSAHRVDCDGDLRVVASPVTHQEFLSATLQPVRQFVRGDWIATNHLLKGMRRLEDMPKLRDVSELICHEIRLVEDDVESSSMTPTEKKLLLDSSHRTRSSG